MMNQIKPHALSRLLLLTLMAGASVAAHAQNPPTWLGWGQSKDAPPAAPAQPATPTETPQPTAAVSQPLGASYAGTGAEGSGQAVIIQNLLENVSRLQGQMGDLRGQVEEQGNEINRLKKAQQSGFSAFDDRISKLEQGGGATGGVAQPPVAPAAAPNVSPPAPAAVPAVPQAPPTAPAPTSGENEKQQTLYNAAFAQLKEGHYEQAITGFQAAINVAPQGQWTPSALFWQGETYYVLQKRTQADASYQKILTDFPKSDRVPDALLKTGYIAYDENKNSQARSIFQKVMSQYPDSQAANLAKQRLSRMTAEKR
ncbi:MAG: tol-pal system protein YbgF [Halothiobacillus sp.]|jgi:tol-pal system protein YbgF|nr:tol-pal system protein YbgF [Halothiobacillus sp.]